MFLEEEYRPKIVEEALSWKGTPFHDHAAVKGAGVDCLHFIYAPYKALGLIEDIEIPQYTPQWYLNSQEDRLLNAIISVGGMEVAPPPKPGDVVVVKFGRVFAHSAIVVDWPTIVTANPKAQKVTVENALVYNLFARPEKKYFSFWKR